MVVLAGAEVHGERDLGNVDVDTAILGCGRVHLWMTSQFWVRVPDAMGPSTPTSCSGRTVNRYHKIARIFIAVIGWPHGHLPA
jgi:hypothetical protein